MPNNKIIIYVSSKRDDFTNKGQLITTWENIKPGEYWTTFSDSGLITNSVAPLYEILKCADQIVYNENAPWGDGDSKDLTEYFLYLVNLEKNNVTGLKKNNKFEEYLKMFAKNLSERQFDEPCIFASGCSITFGIGVKSNQTFASIISKKLNKKLVNIAVPGSGLEVQADQILRSVIRKGDIVIWGLTHELRRPTMWGGNYSAKSYYESSIYLSITSIHQVRNFCKQIGAKLILLPILCSESFQLGLVDLPEYVQLPYYPSYIDLGTDNLHPGPQQHQLWADFILEKCFAKEN